MKEKAESASPVLEVTPPQKLIRPVEGVTKSGFAYRYDGDLLDDMDLFEELLLADNNNPQGGKLALTRILGADGRKALYAHLRAKEGRVRWTSLYRELLEIVEANKTGKN